MGEPTYLTVNQRQSVTEMHSITVTVKGLFFKQYAFTSVCGYVHMSTDAC